eukprot:COSAG06_NODE_1672_length_8747_cov_27.533418_7_plen_191_part_00
MSVHHTPLAPVPWAPSRDGKSFRLRLVPAEKKSPPILSFLSAACFRCLSRACLGEFTIVFEYETAQKKRDAFSAPPRPPFVPPDSAPPGATRRPGRRLCPIQDKTRTGKARQDKTRQEQARQDKKIQHKATHTCVNELSFRRLKKQFVITAAASIVVDASCLIRHNSEPLCTPPPPGHTSSSNPKQSKAR